MLQKKKNQMSKFGELIETNVPVLLDFYTEQDSACKMMHPVLRDVAAALGDKARVIKIDVEKNTALAEALRVKGLPTLMIYKEGEMKWRQSGEQDATTLIDLVKEYV
jgi:thioredoxin 1